MRCRCRTVRCKNGGCEGAVGAQELAPDLLAYAAVLLGEQSHLPTAEPCLVWQVTTKLTKLPSAPPCVGTAWPRNLRRAQDKLRSSENRWGGS